MLYVKDSGAYTFDVSKSSTNCNQNVTTDKNSKDKNSYYKKPKKNSFHNFEQRQYTDDEMDEIEKKLLQQKNS